MAEHPTSVHRLVADGLATAGLQGDLFDTEAIATDLADRLAVDGELDEFVGQGDPGAPVPFDAEDPR